VRAAIAFLAAVSAVAFSAAAVGAVTNRYAGKTSQHQAMSFRISSDGKKVVGFRFVNNCPTNSNKGNLVPGSMPISSRRIFSHHDSEFTVTGKFTTGGATGTARNVTGDCDSGKLRWSATLVRR
jgi:hypothetical protein